MILSEKRYLHHCSFRSEKNQRTEDKLITVMKKVCCQLSPFSHTQVRGDPYTNLLRPKNGNQVATWKTKESGFSLKQKKEQILAEVRTEIQKHEYQADSDRRSIQEFLILSEGKLIILLQVMNNPGETNDYFKNNSQNRIGIFGKLVSKVLMRWMN